jgi:hypothetical protein
MEASMTIKQKIQLVRQIYLIKQKSLLLNDQTQYHHKKVCKKYIESCNRSVKSK